MTRIEELEQALRALLAAHPLPDDLRRVPDNVIAAHDAAEQLLPAEPEPTQPLSDRCTASEDGKHHSSDGWWCDWCSEEVPR
jgi:hypothetical protein